MPYFSHFCLYFLLCICFAFSKPVFAQDFNTAQRQLSELLPLFNQAFEENNLSILKSAEYQKKLKKLQATYTKYNAAHFDVADSIPRMNNEAILIALSGNFHKPQHIFESLQLEGEDRQFVDNRAVFELLAGKYGAARSNLMFDPISPSAHANMLYSFGKQKNISEGISFVDRASGKNQGAKWHYNAALLYELSNNTDQAVEELNAAVRQSNDAAAYRLLRGDLLMKTGQDKKAVKDFEKVSRRFPKGQIRYANALLSLNQFAKAKTVYLKYIEDKNREFKAKAYLGIAHCNYGLQQFDEALRYYKLASSTMRESPALLSGIGNIHLAKHEYQFALSLFDRALKKDPGYKTAFLGRGVANFGLKNYQNALLDFQSAGDALNDKNPFFADIFVSKAFCEYHLGMKQDARTDFEIALQLDPRRYEALAGVGNILIEEKRFSEAGKYLSKALNYEKGYSEMWSNYGNLLLHFDMYEKSFQVFRKAIALKPTNLNAQNGWGVVLLENDKLDRAKAIFDSLVIENPNFSFLHNNHGIVNAYVGNRFEQKQQKQAADLSYNAAFKDFQMAMKTAPQRKMYNVNQGNVYRYWEKFEEANLSYQSYLDKSALNNTAVMYAAREMNKDAKYYLGVAIQIDSLHKVFQYNMNLLRSGKQKEMKKLVASTGDDGPYGDIGIKYSLDGFVTIYLYDYVYDTLTFPGRHFMPLPVETFEENYFIPQIELNFVPYSKKDRKMGTHKKVRYKSQKIKMPGGRSRGGTKCPIFR